MLFSLPFYIGAAWIAGSRKGNVKLTRQQWIYTIGLGLFGYYLSSLFDFMGLKYISAGLERLILFLYPTFSILINAFIFKEKISRLQRIALLLTYTGIVVAYVGELTIDTHNPVFSWEVFDLYLRYHICNLHSWQRQNDTIGGSNKVYRVCHAGFYKRRVCPFYLSWSL